MTRRIIAITIIFGCTSVAWAILGSTIFARTYSHDTVAANRVASTWGSTHDQPPPVAAFTRITTRTEEMVENGKKVTKKVEDPSTIDLSLEGSKVDVALDLEHRQKGLLWYNTYKVNFAGLYSFSNPSDKEEIVRFSLILPTNQAIYDDLVLTVDGVPLAIASQDKAASVVAKVGPHKVATLGVGYRSQGLNEWRYNFGRNLGVAPVKDFQLNMQTNFKEIDFPDNTLSPTQKQESGNGWRLNWSYKNLVSGYDVAMVMPEKLQPGPLAGRISFFAPVSLLFFFFIMFIITTMRGIELHPMNYFFLAAAFFSFHLLLAYLVDHVSIHLAFLISSIVSVFLVVSYLRLVVGFHFASREAAIAQFVYLVMFSYAFFLKGFTGLAITIGSVASLFVTMQVTGRIRWAQKFQLKPPTEPAAELS